VESGKGEDRIMGDRIMGGKMMDSKIIFGRRGTGGGEGAASRQELGGKRGAWSLERGGAAGQRGSQKIEEVR
jgi:hypothetical protein